MVAAFSLSLRLAGQCNDSALWFPLQTVHFYLISGSFVYLLVLWFSAHSTYAAEFLHLLAICLYF